MGRSRLPGWPSGGFARRRTCGPVEKSQTALHVLPKAQAGFASVGGGAAPFERHRHSATPLTPRRCATQARRTARDSMVSAVHERMQPSGAPYPDCAEASGDECCIAHHQVKYSKLTAVTVTSECEERCLLENRPRGSPVPRGRQPGCLIRTAADQPSPSSISTRSPSCALLRELLRVSDENPLLQMCGARARCGAEGFRHFQSCQRRVKNTP